MTDNKTPLRPIRIEEDLWAEFGRLVGTRNRSQVIRDFIRWYVRERGAAMPTRPGDAGYDLPDDLPDLREMLRQSWEGFADPTKAPTSTPDEEEGLSPLEWRLLMLVAENRSDTELAKTLGVTPRTVRARIRRLAAKLQAVGEVKLWVPALKPSLPASD